MRVRDWRRLMDRPKLAPDHVERLKDQAVYMEFLGDDNAAAAIRAALAALGEE